MSFIIYMSSCRSTIGSHASHSAPEHVFGTVPVRRTARIESRVTCLPDSGRQITNLQFTWEPPSAGWRQVFGVSLHLGPDWSPRFSIKEAPWRPHPTPREGA